MGKLGEGLNFRYESIIPQAPVDMKFHYWEELENGEKVLRIHTEGFKLITDIEELKSYINLCKDKRISFDTETTGLTYGKDNIVGFSISLDRWTGFYVPIRHRIKHEVSEMIDRLDENGQQILTPSGRVSRTKKITATYENYANNIDPKEALDVLYQILLSAKVVLLHNSEFDLNMLKFEGYDITKIKAFDNLILPYLYDPEATGMAGLKKLEQRVLGRTVPEFSEVLGKSCENFGEVNPEDGYVYACYDKETEVLTENGWVFWKDYNGHDKLGTFNINKGIIEYQAPLKLFKYKYKGKMECCLTDDLNYCVTPNHRMLVNKIVGKTASWEFEEAGNLKGNPVMLTINSKKEGDIIHTKYNYCCSFAEKRFQADYSDYVYCAEVPNHTLITRRNGSTLVAGNCCDTSGLIGVYEDMLPLVQSLLKRFKNPLVVDGEPYNVLVKDNQMVKMFVDYYGHCKILIDRKKALKYQNNLQEEQKKVVSEIYSYFDRGIFNLSPSSKEFAEVMASKKVFTGIKTDKGGDSYSKKALGEMKRNVAKIKDCMIHYKEFIFANGKLEKGGNGFTLASLLELYGKDYFNMTISKNNIVFKGKRNEPVDLRFFWLTIKQIYTDLEKKVHVLELVQKNGSLNKALNSYVDKLTQVDECFMRYRLKGTKSGRLSSGNGSKGDKRKNHYYIDLNAQNLTKPKSGYYRAEKCSPDDPENILGWKFTSLPDDYALSHLEDEYIVEGQDPNITIRGCLKAPEGNISYCHIPDKNGDTEKDLYEVELENGTKLECCSDTIFKVKCKNSIMYMTLADIIKDKDIEILV